METSVLGIWQGDIVLQSALEACVAELRADPCLIDDALAQLPKDFVTADKYGKKTISECKRWFASTEIDIMLGLKFKYLEKPAILCVELGEENENEATLGDKHYETSEPHPRKPGVRRALESLHADASYTVAVFAQGEPEYMLFLQTLVLFQLLRRKEDLLERRGFEVSRFNMGTAALIEPESKQMMYLRAIKLNGKVFHGWPKKEGPVITSVTTAATPSPNVPNGTPMLSPGWEEQDVLSGLAPTSISRR